MGFTGSKFRKGLLSVREANAEAERDVLMAALDHQKPRQRCQVLPDLNQAFVDILAVRKERKAIGLVEEDDMETLDKSGSGDNNEAMKFECIEVKESDTKLSSSESE